MKMKTVCEKTGLTDRTVRYYIEEDLIHPDYTENYLGRKTFHFSDDDVAQLNDIATLRAFGFSIDNIRMLLQHPEKSAEIINEVRERTEDELCESEKKLGALSSLDVGRIYTVAELARELSTPAETVSAPEPPVLNARRHLLEHLRAAGVFLIVWLPIALVALTLTLRISATDHPIVSPWAIVLSAAVLIPSILTVILTRRSGHRGMLGKRILLGLCSFCIPLSVFFSFGIVNECQHAWGAFVTDAAATCLEEGRLLRLCDLCGAADTATVARLSHTPVTDPARAATCTEVGLTEGAHCAACHTVLTEQTELQRLEHTPTVLNGVEATCTEGGLTSGVICSVCKTVLTGQAPTPKKEHFYRFLANVEATCAENGYILYGCDCGKRIKTKTDVADGNHRFIPLDDHGNFYCAYCNLVVCEHGYADGEGYNQLIRYYITGRAEDENAERTLVICGKGMMPNYWASDPPPWVGRFILEVKHIVIKEGITTMGSFAFYSDGSVNCYQNVVSFVIENPNLTVYELSPDILGIKCPIEYKES